MSIILHFKGSFLLLMLFGFSRALRPISGTRRLGSPLVTCKIISSRRYSSDGPLPVNINQASYSAPAPESRKIRHRLPVFRKDKSADMVLEESRRTRRCLNFLDQSPDPFLCVDFITKQLKDIGFVVLDESLPWRSSKLIQPGGKYLFTRGGSSIVAFSVGGHYKPGNEFKVIGAHTDSPNLKIKPKSKRGLGSGNITQLNVECYGGGLWHTWFDRDLSLSGRVIVMSDNGSRFETRLVKVERSVLRVPNLCIHLRSPDERDAFKVNKEEHLVPILCDQISQTLTKPSAVIGSDIESSDESHWATNQSSELLALLAKELNCSVSSIVDFDLSLYDTQRAATSGMFDEFLVSSRIDNLASCFVAVEALQSSLAGLEQQSGINMVALFDHEEVGSESAPGAGSTLMRDAVDRISGALQSSLGAAEDSELFKVALAKSMILSVDMSHAVHPNYASKHDKAHAPQMNGGVVVKSNANQRYATSGLTGFLLRELGRRSGVPLQEFAVRNDCPCGSTIGPIVAANTGIRAVDLGMPQLSMHSIREMMGCADLTYAHRLFVEFFESFAEVDNDLVRDIK